MDLYGIIDNLQTGLGRIQLGHGRFLSIRLMMLLQLCRTVDEQTGVAQLERHLGQLEADGLLLCDRFSKLHALFRIGQRFLISPLCDAQRLCRDADASAVQRSHRDLKALSFLSQQIFLRYTHILEDQFCRG